MMFFSEVANQKELCEKKEFFSVYKIKRTNF